MIGLGGDNPIVEGIQRASRRHDFGYLERFRPVKVERRAFRFMKKEIKQKLRVQIENWSDLIIVPERMLYILDGQFEN